MRALSTALMLVLAGCEPCSAGNCPKGCCSGIQCIADPLDAGHWENGFGGDCKNVRPVACPVGQACNLSVNPDKLGCADGCFLHGPNGATVCIYPGNSTLACGHYVACQVCRAGVECGDAGCG